MQTNVLNLSGKVIRTIDLDDRVFGITPNESVVHQAVVSQQANARQGTHDTKTRGEVAGGGKKPYRQKGTGYARQGSTRAPHYRKGGVVFGPHPRTHAKALPRKMRRLAIRSVLSARAAEQALTVVDAFELANGKTKELVQSLTTLGIGQSALVVLGTRSEGTLRAAKNLERVRVVTTNGLNLLDALRLPRLVLTESAVQELTRSLTSDLTPTMVEAAPAPAKRAPRAKAATAEAAPEAPAAKATAEAEPAGEEAPKRAPRARKSEEAGA